MHQYENTKFLQPYLEPRQDEIERRVAESGREGDEVQRTADVLRDLIISDPDVRDAMVEAFWQSVDWRLLADMYLGLDKGSSI
jgi:hypothetical protein